MTTETLARSPAVPMAAPDDDCCSESGSLADVVTVCYPPCLDIAAPWPAGTSRRRSCGHRPNALVLPVTAVPPAFSAHWLAYSAAENACPHRARTVRSAGDLGTRC